MKQSLITSAILALALAAALLSTSCAELAGTVLTIGEDGVTVMPPVIRPTK